MKTCETCEVVVLTAAENLADERALDGALVAIDAMEGPFGDRFDVLAIRLRNRRCVEWLPYSEMNGGGGRWVLTA